MYTNDVSICCVTHEVIYLNFFIARRSIYLETQHPDGLEKIRELEAQGRPAKLEIDEPTPMAPTLTDLWVSINTLKQKRTKKFFFDYYDFL